MFLTDLRKWKREIGDQSAVLAVSVVPGAEVVDPWRGVDVGGRFFAWDGPLEDLEDREPVGMPGDLQPDLMEALKKAGALPSWQRRAGQRDRGTSPVFITDKRTYKRAISSGPEFVLVVLLA